MMFKLMFKFMFEFTCLANDNAYRQRGVQRSLLLNNSNDSERLSIEMPVKFHTQVYQRFTGEFRAFLRGSFSA